MVKGVLFLVLLVTASAVGASERESSNNKTSYIIKLKESVSTASFFESYAGMEPTGAFQVIWPGFVASLNETEREALERDPRVEKVIPDQEVYLDQKMTQQSATWGLSRLDQRESEPDRQYDYTHTGKGVTVYLIDTGINVGHEEFKGRAKIGAAFAKTLPDDGGDCHGHGSHVGGIVGGTRFGVAKRVQLVGVRALDCEGRGTLGQILRSIDWVAKNGKPRSIINISIGTASSVELDETIEKLTKESGFTFVVSAGNAAGDACAQSPARATAAVTVGATDWGDTRAPYSNDGRCVDVFAPGTDILSAHKGAANSTKVLSGTSMATPFVSGVLALAMEQFPKSSSEQVRQLVLKNATKKVVSKSSSANNHLVYSLFGL